MSPAVSWLLLLAVAFCAYRLLIGIASRSVDGSRADGLMPDEPVPYWPVPSESLPLPDGVREWQTARLEAWWSA